MKRTIKSVLLAAALFAGVQVQAQKMGHINLDSLLSVMPESKAAKQAQADYYKQLESTIISMQTELQAKYKAYQDEQSKLTPLIKETREKELNDLNQRIQDFQASAQQDLQKKNDELTKPIFDKAKKAIETVAKENGYKYVLDTSAGNVLYSEPGDDILPIVMKKMGITPGSAPKNEPPKTNNTPPDPKKPK